VLVVNVELCSLHFQETADLERNLSAMLFADGAAAALVSADPSGAALHDFRSAALAGSEHMITWKIGDQGFDMHLSGDVPQRIEAAMRAEAARNDDGGLLRGARPEDFALWAVHGGGRTILDAVENGLGLGPNAMAVSRSVLRDFGNMSSATLMFVLARMLADAGAAGARGVGFAFGPGLAAESFRFTRL
jgi:predicted naringenin-chalcone synthase